MTFWGTPLLGTQIGNRVVISPGLGPDYFKNDIF